MGAAREKVRVAKALPELPRLSGALQRGEISYAKVRALTRVAGPENEERLLELATRQRPRKWNASRGPGVDAIGSRRRGRIGSDACLER